MSFVVLPHFQVANSKGQDSGCRSFTMQLLHYSSEGVCYVDRAISCKKGFADANFLLPNHRCNRLMRFKVDCDGSGLPRVNGQKDMTRRVSVAFVTSCQRGCTDRHLNSIRQNFQNHHWPMGNQIGDQRQVSTFASEQKTANRLTLLVDS